MLPFRVCAGRRSPNLAVPRCAFIIGTGVDFPGGMAYMEDMNHNRIPASLGKMRRRAVHSRLARTSDNLRCLAAPVDL
jgi:hypothetical protein